MIRVQWLTSLPILYRSPNFCLPLLAAILVLGVVSATALPPGGLTTADCWYKLQTTKKVVSELKKRHWIRARTIRSHFCLSHNVPAHFLQVLNRHNPFSITKQNQSVKGSSQRLSSRVACFRFQDLPKTFFCLVRRETERFDSVGWWFFSRASGDSQFSLFYCRVHAILLLLPQWYCGKMANDRETEKKERKYAFVSVQFVCLRFSKGIKLR